MTEEKNSSAQWNQQLCDSFGLTQNESECYLHLLEYKGIPASMLAKRLGYKRSTAKYTLNQLVKQNIATVLEKNGTHLFFPVSPQDLSTIFDIKKQELERKKQSYHAIEEGLLSLHQTSQNIPKVQFFEGVEGLKKMYWDVIEENKTIYGYSRVDNKNVHPEILEFLYEKYIPARKKAGNKAFMIYNGEVNQDYLNNDEQIKRTTLFFPTKEVEFESCFHIYGNKIAFYSRKIDDLTGVIIENKTIKENQFSLFKMAWNHARNFSENKRYKNISIQQEQ